MGSASGPAGDVWFAVPGWPGQSPDGLWAVGTDVVPYFEGFLYFPYAAVWNGSIWTVVPSTGSGGLSAVTASGSAVWATAAGTVSRLSLSGPTPQVTPTGNAEQLTGITADSAGNPWAVGWSTTKSTVVPAIINAPGIGQGGVVVTTGVSGATVTWIGRVTGSGLTDPSGSFSTGGLPAGSYHIVAGAAGCTPGIATATVASGMATAVTVHVTC
jgi:hypothetical protein